MPKNIVLLSDGTGNSAARLTKTNVWRCYEALDLADPSKQIAFYDDGVGTSSFRPLAIIGGAFGYGVKRNVLDLYTFLCRNYKDDDCIYIFGFSRGAFTACLVAGLIASEGIVRCETEEALQKHARNAYREYRRKHFTADLPLDRIFRRIRDLFTGRQGYLEKRKSVTEAERHVTFLGVWDTVGAYGLPIDELTQILNWFWRLYPRDRNAPEAFDRVCHAVAIDDERQTFHPMLFNEEGQDDVDHVDKERITQVWFAGMHSNVGGGYPDDGLSYVSLDWMLDRAKKKGLLLEPKTREIQMLRANAVGMLYDSRKGLGGLYRYMPRDIAALCDTDDRDRIVKVARPKIHYSVIRRIKLGSDSYAPIGLPEHYAVATRKGHIVDGEMCGPTDVGRQRLADVSADDAQLSAADLAECLERPESAARRADEQENVWKIVWHKRVTYFGVISVVLFLLAFPWFVGPHEPACRSSYFCFLSPVIIGLGALLPDFLGRWIDAFRSNPGWFALLAVLIGVQLWVGDKLQLRIRDSMRRAWKRSLDQENSAYKEEPVRHRALSLFGAVLGIALIVGLSYRVLFAVADSAGTLCSDTISGISTFDTGSPCWKTGYTLTAGKKYVVHLNVKPQKDGSAPCTAQQQTLLDKNIGTGLGGHTTWYLTPFIPFRRHLAQNWFAPAARIGRHGDDEYVLSAADGQPADRTTCELYAEITARRSGPLYLFVNDAVLPTGRWQPFYRNNDGYINYDVSVIDAANGTRTPLAEQPGTGQPAR